MLKRFAASGAAPSKKLCRICGSGEDRSQPQRLAFLMLNGGESIVKAVLSGGLRPEIYAQLEATYPDEGGGFLLGRAAGDAITIVEIMQVANVFAAEERHHRYAMAPRDWLRLEDEAEARGLSLVGYYHSHPDSAAIPSEYDREHALPNFLYLIASVMMGRAVDLRGWRLLADRSGFERVGLELSDG